MKDPIPTSSAARQFALMALAGCASLSAVRAAQTLRYNFEDVTDVNNPTVINLAPGETPDGTFVNPEKLALLTGEEITVNAVRYQLGKSLQLNNDDGETGTAGHVDTGLPLSGWGMASATNVMNRSFTAMAWVKFGSTAGDNMVFGQLGEGIHLGTRGANLHSGHWGDDIGPDQGINVPPGTTSWRHVAWVNNVQDQSMYLDGVLVAGPGATGASAASGLSLNLLIGTFANTTGSFVGSIDEVKVFGDQVLTQAQIQTEMTNTLTAVPLAAVASAKLDNVGFTFTIQDFLPNSVVNPASVQVLIDDTAVTPISVNKTGSITTVQYTLPALLPPGTSHTWEVRAKDQTNPVNPNIISTGTLLMPVLPPTIPGPAGTVGTWGVREYRSPTGFGSALDAIAALAALDATDPDPATNEIFDGTAPVMNHTDPESPGGRGNFNNDLPFIGNDAGDENNFAVVGKTQVTVPAAGSYTFSVRSDDGFALRISGGPANNTSRFTSSNRADATSGIDPSDPQTIYFSPGTGDSATTGVYEFSAAGTYDVLFVVAEQTGGAFYELAWTPGSFRWDYQTTTWTLVGSPNDPTVTAVPFSPRFIADLPGPQGGENTWGIRTFTAATTGSTTATHDWLRDTGSLRVPDDAETIDVQRNYLNMSDNYTNAVQDQTGHITPDDVLPGVTTNLDNVATVAKGRVRVTTPATYTFNARGDDGFMLRVEAVTGPNPKFTSVSNNNPNNGEPKLEMSNLNEMWYQGGTGDTLTRGVIDLPAGDYDLTYFQWEGGGGFWYELTAAIGSFPHGSEPPAGWQLVGTNFTPPAPAGLPQISPAGWSVTSSAPGSLPADQGNLAGALVALAASGTTTTADAVNFNDPQSGGGPGTAAPASPWPGNTAGDDNNFAMKAVGTLVVPAAGLYHLGFQSDDGGSLTIRGVNGTPTPSFDAALVANATGAGVAEAADAAQPEVLNRLRTDVPTGNSRTIGSIQLAAGSYELEGYMYEIGGGAYWSVFGAIVTGADPAYYPLSKGGVVPPFAMLPLVAAAAPSAIAVTNFTFNPATGAYSLTFASAAGTNYQLEYSTTMAAGAAGNPQSWNAAPGATIAGQAGTTTVSGNVTGLQPGAGGVLPVGSPRVFLRVKQL